MVVTVVVTGVPRLMSLENLCVEFNNVLGESDLGDFRIRDIAISSNTMLRRQVALDFQSGFDAMTVQEKLDGFEFITSIGSCNVIKAKIQTALVEPESSTKVVISTTSKNYYYEPCVENINESLDVQIDLLKKQTLALKAHRKYIREQKKLKKEFTKLDAESDDELPRTSKSRKRKRLRSADSGSPNSVDRSKSRDNNSSPKSSERRKRSRFKTCEDYLTIKYKKISTTHRSMSREARTRVRSNSHEKPSSISESYKKRSRSRSCDKRKAAYCAVKYRKSTHNREANSPEPGTSSHRVVRSKSRGNHRSPSRISGPHRRSRSRNRKKYYSVETIEYKKASLTKTKPLKSGSEYESRDQVFTSTSSKQRRSQSPYNGNLPSSIDSRKRKIAHSRSLSNFMKTAYVNSSLKCYRNRSPSTENISTISYEKSRLKYNDDSCSKSEYSFSKPLDSQRKITKATENRKSFDREDQIRTDAVIQANKMKAMEDVLFEMELLLRQERNTISNTDKMFLTDLVKSIVKIRFQKLQVHDCLLVSDVFNRYRRQYSKVDDINLLRNLAGECKSLDEVTSIVVAKSTADVPDPQSKNDEIWTAVDEVLDGVDIDLLQAEPDTNQVKASEIPIKESQAFDEVETVNVTNSNLPGYNGIPPKNSTSETDLKQSNTKCVLDGPKNPNNTKNNAMNNKVDSVDLPSDTMKKNETITSSEIDLINPKASKHNLTIDLTAADIKANVLNTKCGVALPAKTHDNNNKLQSSVKIESIELSDDSDGDINNIRRINITSATNQEHMATYDSIWTSNFTDVVSLANMEKHEQSISNSIKKKNIPTVDLTDDTDEIEISVDQTNIAMSATHLLKPIKQEIVTDLTNGQSNVALPPTNLSSYIKQENMDFNIDKIKTRNDEPNVSIFDSNVERSNKKVAIDMYMKHNNCGILSKTYILNTIKQEPGTNETPFASLDHPDKPELNNEKSKDTILETEILKSIKMETDFTNCGSETDMKKGIANTTVPVKSAKISNCIRREILATTVNDVSQTEITDINNDQITMPVPIILSSIKKEYVGIVNSVSESQCNITDINNDNIVLPGPITSISTKQENEALNNIIKNEDKPIVKNDSPSQTDIMDINNHDQIKIPRPINSNCTMQKYVANGNDSTNQSELSKRNRKQSNNKKDTKINSTKHLKHGEKSMKHKQERLSSIKFKENNIKHKEQKDSCIKLKKETDGSIKSKEKQDSTIKQKDKGTFKRLSTNLTPSRKISNKSEPDIISESSYIKDDEEKSNNKKQNLQIDKVLPTNPRFVLPTHIIMRGLKALIIKTFNENDYMFNITRKVLQDRFKDLVKDKGYVNTKNIIKMYKDFYAEEKYTDFLSGIVSGIKAGKYDDEIKKIAMQRHNVEKKKLTTLENNSKDNFKT